MSLSLLVKMISEGLMMWHQSTTMLTLTRMLKGGWTIQHSPQIFLKKSCLKQQEHSHCDHPENTSKTYYVTPIFFLWKQYCDEVTVLLADLK